jgi:hypothetical protein
LLISLATIDRMVRANELPSVLIRGRRLFRIRDVMSISVPTAFPAANRQGIATTFPKAFQMTVGTSAFAFVLVRNHPCHLLKQGLLPDK